MPPHFELKSNEMADLKKKENRRKKTTNESLNSHWLPANVAGRLTVLPANCKIPIAKFAIGVIYTGDAGDMFPPLFEMTDFVPTTF